MMLYPDIWAHTNPLATSLCPSSPPILWIRIHSLHICFRLSFGRKWVGYVFILLSILFSPNHTLKQSQSSQSSQSFISFSTFCLESLNLASYAELRCPKLQILDTGGPAGLAGPAPPVVEFILLRLELSLAFFQLLNTSSAKQKKNSKAHGLPTKNQTCCLMLSLHL